MRNRGAATRSFPAAPVPSPVGRGRPGSASVVPLGELAGATDVVDRVEGAGRVAGDDGMAWDVYLKQPGRPRVRVAWPAGRPETRHLFGGQGGRGLGQSRYGDLVIAERAPRPVIDEHEQWQPDVRLGAARQLLRRWSWPGPGPRGTRRCCAGSGPPTRTSSAFPWRASGSASRPTWTRCRSSARPSRCGTANGTCTSARRVADRTPWPRSSTTTGFYWTTSAAQPVAARRNSGTG